MSSRNNSRCYIYCISLMHVNGHAGEVVLAISCGKMKVLYGFFIIKTLEEALALFRRLLSKPNTNRVQNTEQ